MSRIFVWKRVQILLFSLVTPHLYNENSRIHKTVLCLLFLNVIDVIWHRHWTEVWRMLINLWCVQFAHVRDKGYILAAVKKAVIQSLFPLKFCLWSVRYTTALMSSYCSVHYSKNAFMAYYSQNYAGVLGSGLLKYATYTQCHGDHIWSY